MEKKAREIWQRFVAQPLLWQGWEHRQVPVGFFTEQKGVLFGHPQPPPEFCPLEKEGVTYLVARPKPQEFTANTAVSLNGTQTATVMWPKDETAYDLLPLVSHEAFHAYQRTKACPSENISLTMYYPVNDGMVNAYAEAEAALLQRALTREFNPEMIRAALDARASRQALLSPELVTYEDNAEFNEGLATYVEMKSAGSGTPHWEKKLSGLGKINRNGWGADRLRFYYSGMAWALLCDTFVSGWQAGAWQLMARLAAQALDYTPTANRREFPGLDFAEILARQKEEAAARQRKVSATLARVLPGNGLKVDIKTVSEPVSGAWNPMTSETLPGIGRLHTSGLIYKYAGGASLEVKKDCLEKRPCRHMLFEQPNLTVLLNSREFKEGEGEGFLVVQGDDCAITIPRARVNYSKNTLLAEEVG